jgi:hypothetical protein
MTINLHPSIKNVFLDYKGLSEVFGTLGGYLEIIGYLTLVIFSYNRFKMLVFYFRRFKRKQSLQRMMTSKPIGERTLGKTLKEDAYKGSFCQYILYVLSDLCCCCKNLQEKMKYEIDLDEFEEKIYDSLDLPVLLKAYLPKEEKSNETPEEKSKEKGSIKDEKTEKLEEELGEETGKGKKEKESQKEEDKEQTEKEEKKPKLEPFDEITQNKE